MVVARRRPQCFSCCLLALEPVGDHHQLEGDRADLEVNPNAIELARERIGGLNEGIDTAIEEYFELLAEARR